MSVRDIKLYYDEICQQYQDMLNGFKNKRLVSPLCQRCSYIKRFK